MLTTTLGGGPYYTHFTKEEIEAQGGHVHMVIAEARTGTQMYLNPKILDHLAESPSFSDSIFVSNSLFVFDVWLCETYVYFSSVSIHVLLLCNIL